MSRTEKNKDKELLEKNKSLKLATYNLQSVLLLPRGDISIFYYKSKLNTYNFTICPLNSNSDQVECYTWHEGEAKRGAIEIGSCVWKFMEKTAKVVDDEELEFIFYSDNCCGQQKNRYLIAMYMHAVDQLKIKSITHKYLITGHTQNEGDNVHFVIEKAVKRHLKSGINHVTENGVEHGVTS